MKVFKAIKRCLSATLILFTLLMLSTPAVVAQTTTTTDTLFTVNAVEVGSGKVLNMFSNLGGVVSFSDPETRFVEYTRFTPYAIDSSQGQGFGVSVSDYDQWHFAYWENGDTNRGRTVRGSFPPIDGSANTSGPENLTAYYYSDATTPPTTVTVNSATVDGEPLTGLSTDSMALGNSTGLRTGYTPVKFSLTEPAEMYVTVADYGGYYFDHWEDGSTNNGRIILLDEAMTITAYYRNTTETR